MSKYKTWPRWKAMVSKLQMQGHSNEAAEMIANADMKARVAKILANIASGDTVGRGVDEDDAEQRVRY